MVYEIRGLYGAEISGADTKGIRDLQMGRLNTYRRMLESSRSIVGADVMTAVNEAGKCNEGEECGENA